MTAFNQESKRTKSRRLEIAACCRPEVCGDVRLSKILLQSALFRLHPHRTTRFPVQSLAQPYSNQKLLAIHVGTLNVDLEFWKTGRVDLQPSLTILWKD